jgi:hypothetical protein
MPKTPQVGLYLSPATVVNNPGYLEALIEKIGLTWVILTFTGELPPEVLAHSPFAHSPFAHSPFDRAPTKGEWASPERVTSLLAHHLDGRPSTTKLDSARKGVGPHVGADHDEATLRRAIAMAHAAGLRVWLLAGMYTANDFDVLMYSPYLEANNRWYEALYTHMATAYGVQGVDVTHARYPMTSYPRGLFLDMRPEGAAVAAELGFDFAAMQADIRHALTRVQQLDATQWATLAATDLGPLDLLQFTGMHPGVLDWFRFRAEVLIRNVARFRRAVHAAAGPDFIFGVDTYPASLATLAGHAQARWGEFSDFASPLLSHVDIFPMKTLVVWAEWLMSTAPSLREAEALTLAYRLAGYAGLRLPDTIADFALGEPDCEYRHIPLRDFVRWDMAKAKLALPAGMPAYPILQGGGAPWDWPVETVQQLMQDALDLGYDGYIFQGTRGLLDFPLT